jgi:hypothetical protein
MKRTARKDERVFAVKCLIRAYTYRAFVTKKGGKLRCITAGCRYWQSFSKAFAHYRGETGDGLKWHDTSIGAVSNALLGDGFSQAARTFAERLEARKILTKLEARTNTYYWNRLRRRGR